MKNNPILRVRVFYSWGSATIGFTRFSNRTKNIHTHTYRAEPFTICRFRKFLLMLDRCHKGRFRNHGNGYSYLAWQGRKQNAS